MGVTVLRHLDILLLVLRALFQDNDPGTHNLTIRFLQECRFLISIKHPNIVQCLGTIRDPESRRPVLLMELMDESLTKFLERSTASVPYHIQVNICYDVALALAYLHSNSIIHRDLSSNNVLLIGSGSRAKVTDFGMSKFVDMNPRMTPLTQCPGTMAYMPPEALTAPPHYSSKMDCFSHGVLTIQVETRNFPDPGDATTVMKDARFPTGRALLFVPEVDRRKKDIDLIASDHPVLPIILQCIKDEEGERPSANELCEQLASLKGDSRYTYSVEQTKDQASRARALQLQLDKKNEELAAIQEELAEMSVTKQNESDESRRELNEKHRELTEYQGKLAEKQRELAAKEEECRGMQEQLRLRETAKTDCELKPVEEQHQNAAKKEEVHTKSREDNSHQHINQPLVVKPKNIPVHDEQKECKQVSANPVKLSWRKGKQPPKTMSSLCGAAIVHGDTAFFSFICNVYSYKILDNEWTVLQRSEYQYFSLAIVNDTLTTIGGCTSDFKSTDTLLSLTQSGLEMKWGKYLPPMMTKRILPVTISITTHLIVAAGRTKYVGGGLFTVEVMDTETFQWSVASSLPQDVMYPQMTLCNGYIYLSDGGTVFSCSVEGLLQSCQLPPQKPTSIDASKSDSIWTRQADIPVTSGGSSLTTLGEHVLAIGGEPTNNNPSADIHYYDKVTDSWSVMGEMPTSQSRPLVTVFPSYELVVVRVTTEIGKLVG